MQQTNVIIGVREERTALDKMKWKLIIILMILSISFLNATEYTRSTETNCVNGICNKVLYSGIRFVNEDNQWKNVWEAKSLKGSGVECLIISDGEHIAECEDWNYTAIKLKTSLKDTPIFGKNVPISVYKRNESTQELIKQSEKSNNYNLLDSLKSEWINVNYGDVIHFGENSTTIQLQDADTENLDDTYLAEINPDNNYGTSTILYTGIPFADELHDHFAIIKFNVSSIPSDVIILNSNLNLYYPYNNLDSSTEGWNVSSHYYSNQSWVENVPTFNNFDYDYNPTPSDDIKFFGGVGKPVGWISWNITSFLDSSFDDDNCSIFLYAHDLFGSTSSDVTPFYSKEYSTTSLRPYLNITYEEQEPEIDTTPRHFYIGDSNFKLGNGRFILR